MVLPSENWGLLWHELVLRLPGELNPLPISLAVSVLSLLAAQGEVLNLVSMLSGLVTSAALPPPAEEP